MLLIPTLKVPRNQEKKPTLLQISRACLKKKKENQNPCFLQHQQVSVSIALNQDRPGSPTHLDTTPILSPTDCDGHQFRQPVLMHEPNMTSVQLSWKLLFVETQIKHLTNSTTPQAQEFNRIAPSEFTTLSYRKCPALEKSLETLPYLLMVMDFQKNLLKMQRVFQWWYQFQFPTIFLTFSNCSRNRSSSVQSSFLV